MTNSNDKGVVVFVGNRLEDPGEIRAVNRLRRDLERNHVEAVLFVNFVTTGRQQRQIDLLVITRQRLVHCELKVFDQNLPVIGRRNSAWKQVLPDGSERELEGNPYRQAQEATFAISDVMRSLAREGRVPKTEKFYRFIDTVVCVFPTIPRGSQLDDYAYVEAIGYEELLDRVVSKGPHLQWTEDDWQEFIRQLGLFRDQEPKETKTRTDSVHIVADYQRRFREAFSKDLHELVPVAVEANSKAGFQQSQIAQEVSRGTTVVLLGDSGLGKSHTARHAAIELTDEGHTVVWLRCAEYEPSHFDSLLARAVAPFTTEHASGLIRRAFSVAAEVLLVLDGWNECPEPARDALLRELSGFWLSHPVGTIITSRVQVRIPTTHPSTEVRLSKPNATEREAMLASYGIDDASKVSEEFTTPYELSLLALCDENLDEDSTKYQLIDAYIRSLAQTETIRAALRTIATAMEAELRSSLPILEAMALLQRAGGIELTPKLADEALANPLLNSRQGRVSFQHEVIARFLAAEALIFDSSSGSSLGRVLSQPQHRELGEYALAIEPNDDRREQALAELADSELYLQAAVGKFGESARTQVVAAVCSLLGEAAMSTSEENADLTADPVVFPGARWSSYRQWSASEIALLSTAGMGLWEGLFVDEVVALLDRTDDLCSRKISEVRAAGITNPVSVLVSSTYALVSHASGENQSLAASILVDACTSRKSSARFLEKRPSVASRLLEQATNASWGRLYLAAAVFNPDDPIDGNKAAELLSKAWDAIAYHVRLEALWAVGHSVRGLDHTSREAVVSVLGQLRTDHLLLNTALVEAMASFDMIEEPMASLSDIRSQIEDVLSREKEAEAQTEAARIIGQQFEKESIVGPYCEAIDSLPGAERLTLFLMAAQSSDGLGLYRDWVLNELANRATPDDERIVRVLGQEASQIPEDVSMLQDSIAAHLAAIRGWAQIAPALPRAPAPGSIDDQAWRSIDELVFGLERGEVNDFSDLWQLIHEDLASAAIDVFYRLSWAAVVQHMKPTMHDRLAKSFPTQIRQLLEWGLANRKRLTSKFRFDDAREREVYIVKTLGQVGVASTVSLLHSYVVDPEVGEAAVASIRAIENRRVSRA